MADVLMFNHAMIETYLKNKSLRYLRDSDGDFVVEYAYDTDVDAELTFFYIAGGSSKQIYSVSCRSNKRFARQDWPRVLTLCNSWNDDRRWPKAYFHMSDQSGTVLLEEQLSLEKGIHQELFDDFTSTVVAASVQFWIWFKDQHVMSIQR